MRCVHSVASSVRLVVSTNWSMKGWTSGLGQIRMSQCGARSRDWGQMVQFCLVRLRVTSLTRHCSHDCHAFCSSRCPFFSLAPQWSSKAQGWSQTGLGTPIRVLVMLRAPCACALGTSSKNWARCCASAFLLVPHWKKGRALVTSLAELVHHLGQARVKVIALAKLSRELYLRILWSMKLIDPLKLRIWMFSDLISLQLGIFSGSRLVGRKTRVARLEVSHIKRRCFANFSSLGLCCFVRQGS